jgi:hypothetical protein
MTAPAMRPADPLDRFEGALVLVLVLVLELVGDEVAVCSGLLNPPARDEACDARSDDAALPIAGVGKLAAAELAALNCTIPDIIAGVERDCFGGGLLYASDSRLDTGACITPSEIWVIGRTCRGRRTVSLR